MFRAAVLARDPICTRCELAASTVVGHYPLSRRELIEQDLDPNDPERGRGLCRRCHDMFTAAV
jgi:5-methylcytosine-specific restriction enzyme A